MKAVIKETGETISVWRDTKTGLYYRTGKDSCYNENELRLYPTHPLLNVKAFTDVEQSRKMINIGIDPNTADMWSEYRSFPDEDHPGEDWYKPQFIPLPKSVVKTQSDKYDWFFEVNRIRIMKLRQGGILPRWSYAALTNILPEEIISEYKKLGTDLPVRYYLNTDVMHTYVFIHDLEDYEVVNDIPKRLFQTSAGNWLDAAFEMVCKLKEEKYI